MSMRQTFTGKQFDIENPRLDQINIRDIAHHLSMICRFGGATKFHYSVAQHCCLLAQHGGKEDEILWRLLHDAPEAYYGDIVRPSSETYAVLREVHRQVDIKVYTRFGLLSCDEPYLGLPPAVRRADDQLCLTEAQALLSHFDPEDFNTKRPLPGVEIVQLTPTQAEVQFLTIFEVAHNY